jgi:hypothetical protein
MDSASNARLLAIVDRLLASPFIAHPHRLLVEEAKEILEGRPPTTITIRHDPRTVPEPAIITARVPEVGR